MQRALNVAEKAYVPGHPMLAVIQANLGGLYKSLGRRSEARPLLENALAAKEKSFGPDDPRLASDLTQLGDLYRLDGQCARAEPLFLRARAIAGATVREVPVLFATDRKRDARQSSVAFGGERALFGRLSQSIRAKGGGFTLYASRSDWALRFWEWLWGEARAGYIGNDTPLIAPGVDTLDITAAGTSLFALNHDLYASSPILVADMRRILQSGTRPPDKRSKAFERVDSKDGGYWRLRSLQAAD